MNTLELPHACTMLPNRIEGDGIEVFLLDSLPGNEGAYLQPNLYTLITVIDGAVTMTCNSTREVIAKDQAMLIKKDTPVQIDRHTLEDNKFRGLLIAFDEPALMHALIPFRYGNNNSSTKVLKIPSDEKLKVFTDSMVLHYPSLNEQNNGKLLLQSKLRELIWILLHTVIKDQAKAFFCIQA